MEAIKVMKRYELKYLMDKKQTAALRKALKGHMQIDAYGLTTIASLYYDTPDARLVRASLEKPEYKEKLRLRSYGLATESSPVYLELKRKAEGIVSSAGLRPPFLRCRPLWPGPMPWRGMRRFGRNWLISGIFTKTWSRPAWYCTTAGPTAKGKGICGLP